ncbi:hypothetical protein CCP3SC1AL1_1560010 [Gammaproteobacteria bacterium]
MEKISVVKNVTYKNNFTGQHGTIYYHTIEFENGDKGEYGSKKQDQTTFIIGKEINYEYISEEKIGKDGKPWTKIIIKPIYDKQTSSPKSPSYKGKTPEQIKSILKSVARDTAIDISRNANQEKLTEQHVLDLSNAIYDWLNKADTEEKRIIRCSAMKITAKSILIKYFNMNSTNNILEVATNHYNYISN